MSFTVLYMSIFLLILLTVVILTLTILVATAGIQVFHILHDFRQTLQKLNRILDNTQVLSEASAKPVAAVNEFFAEVKTLVDQTEDEIISATPDRVIKSPSHVQAASSKHFFRRSGSPLRPS